MNRPSLNLQALFSDTDSTQDDNWMISYIDVFVLMTTIFVMLLVMSKSQLGLTSSNTKGLEKPVHNVSEFNVEQKKTTQSVIDPHTEVKQDTDWLKSITSSIEMHELENLVQLKGDANFTELQIQSRVLFDSGDSELTRSGVSVLEKLLPVLRVSEGLIFIEGHTDNRPIVTDRFRSNWDLASARATEVLQFFVAEGMSGNRLRAVSYGDTKPLVSNDSDRNRRKNRRVSLMIQRQVL